MSAISSIVNVNISVQAQGVPRTAYNICMLLSTTKAFTALYSVYNDMSAIQAVFAPTTPEYVAAQTFFSQTPSSTPLMIGRRPADSVVANLAPIVDIAYTYNITINSTTTSVAGSTATSQQSFIISNTASGATTIFAAGQVINMTVNGTAIAPVTATGTNATDIDAIIAAITTAGGANIGTPVSSNVTDASVTITIPIASTSTAVPVTLSSIAVTPVDDIVVTTNTPTYSVQLLCNMLAAAINASTAINTIVLATPNASQVIVNSKTNEADGGAPWTFSVSSSYTGATTAFTSSAYNAAYIQIITESALVTYSATINGVRYSYYAPSLPNAFLSSQEAALGLYNAITGATNPPDNVTVSLAGSNNELILLQSTSPEQRFTLSASPLRSTNIIARIYTTNPTATNNTSAGVQTDLTNLADTNNSWYAVACTDRTPEVVEGIAAYVLSNKKLFGTASSDSNIYSLAAGVDTTSIAAILNAAGGDRTFCVYHQDAGTSNGSYANSYPEMAWFGKMLNSLPGSKNWAFQQLSAILPTVGLSDTDVANILAKNCNLFYRVAGVSITRAGSLSSGPYGYIDILRGSDWLVSSIAESVFAAIVSAGKIPYTDKGIAVVGAIISQQLQLAIDNGYLSSTPAPTVTVPSAASVSTADKANRTLNNVSFSATLAGAINTVTINGTLGY